MRTHHTGTGAPPPLALLLKISPWPQASSRQHPQHICPATLQGEHQQSSSLPVRVRPSLRSTTGQRASERERVVSRNPGGALSEAAAAMAQALRSASLASSFCGTSEFVGSVELLGRQNGARVVARFAAGTKKVKQAAKSVQKKASGSGASRPLWFPGAKAPEWLDGSLVGDYGFDPLSLGKSPEYLQVELDSLNQNLAKNEAGNVIGSRVSKKANINPTPFQPYSEVFGLQRFRECELIHGRWAMLAILGALSVEALTGVTWQDAGKVELLDGASYFGLPLPFSITSLVYIEALLVGFIEFYRNGELNPEKRLYPGGKFFDPLNFADTSEKKEILKLAEIKHARLAMVAALGFAVQAAATGKGPLDNWATHLADPLHTTIFDTFSK